MMRYFVIALIIALVHPIAALPAPAQVGLSGVTESFGVDVGAGGDPASVAREGIKWVRMPADWSTLEPARGTFVWIGLDALVTGAAAAGMQTVLVIMNTPRWAALEPTAPEDVWRHQPPRDLADWQRFVAAAAARYRGRVVAWQVEPTVDFVAFRGSFQDYVGMLHAARRAVRQADPQALVVAASAPGLDLAYVKALFVHLPDEFDAVMLSSRARTPEEVLEALGVIRGRIITDTHHQLWLENSDAGGRAASPDDAVGDHMVRMAVIGLAGGVARQIWSGRPATARWAAVRGTIIRMLDGTRLIGWLPRGSWLYAFVMGEGGTSRAALWTTAEDRTVPLAAAEDLKITSINGSATGPSSRGATPSVPVGRSPVFVQGLAASVLEEAAQASQHGPFQIPRDPGHDFSRAESIAVNLGAMNAERGLYNQRFRSLAAGALVPLTVEGVEAVRTDSTKDAVYVYLDADHSYAYFIDGREDLLVAVEVHRARTDKQVGFNILYDSMTGYRFTPWQWVEAGAGWVTYTVRLTDAAFSSAWGWDLAVNGAADKKEPLVVRSVSIRKTPRNNP